MSARVTVAILVFSALSVACGRRIPPAYEYEQGWVTAEHPAQKSRFLAGQVVDASGSPLKFVLVERMTPDFTKRLEATLTDEQGHFRFRSISGSRHFLRFRLRAFNDYLLPVSVERNASNAVKVSMEISN